MDQAKFDHAGIEKALILFKRPEVIGRQPELQLRSRLRQRHQGRRPCRQGREDRRSDRGLTHDPRDNPESSSVSAESSRFTSEAGLSVRRSQQCLYLLPLPHGQGSFRLIFGISWIPSRHGPACPPRRNANRKTDGRSGPWSRSPEKGEFRDPAPSVCRRKVKFPKPLRTVIVRHRLGQSIAVSSDPAGKQLGPGQHRPLT